MKKSFFAFTALAAILAGCAKEVDTNTPETIVPGKEKVVILRASVPDADTKVITDNIGAFKWQAGDKVTVLNTEGTAFEFSTQEGGTEVDFGSSTFTGTLSTEAFYPASANHTSGKFYLEPSFTWVQDASMMPMLGVVDPSGPTASFKSCGGILKLICYNVDDDARKLVVTSATKQITGQFTPSGDPKVIASADKSENNNILTINFAAGHASNMVFYIPLPTGNVGVLTFTLKDGTDATLFEKATKAAVTMARNKMIVAPALNCDPDITLWRESFTNYDANTAWASATEMNVGGSYDAEKYGDATITYQTEGTTKIYARTYAGGTSPELSFNKSSGDNEFTVRGLPTKGAATMTITFLEQSDGLSVSSPTTGVTITGKSYVSHVYTATVNNANNAATIDLVFTNTVDSYCAFDEPMLFIAGSSKTVPVITSGLTNLTIAIGSLSKSTSVGITNPIDELGLSYVISKKDDKPIDWIESVAISEGTLTVTAMNANGEAVDREAVLTLKATGATDKVLNLKQTTALVPKPASITTIPGNASMSASWTKADHATGYLAYLCESTGLADPTVGIALTPSIDGSTVSVSKPDGLTNGTTYYLYIKVNTVDANYIADSEWAEESVTPENVIYYEKITAVGDIEPDVKYLIVNEAAGKALDGSVATAANYNTANQNFASVTIGSNKIVANPTTNALSVTISGDEDEYTILTASGFYLGQSSGTGMTASSDTPREHSITFNEGNAVIKDNETPMYMRYNSSWAGFRYYAGSSVSPVQLYKYYDPRTPAGLAWKMSGVAAKTDGATMLTGNDTMPTIALDNPNGLAVTFTSSDPTVATVTSSSNATSVSDGAVTSLLKAGTTVITASFADGDATYRPATVRYTLTVTDNRYVVATPTFSDVTVAYPEVNALSDAKSITISCGTEGATIYYTTGSSDFDPSSWTEGNSVSITGLTTVRAVAVKSDHKNSAEGIVSYRIAGSASALPDPNGLEVTAITASTLKFSWINDTNADDYEWIVSTSSTYSGIKKSGEGANVIASGDTSHAHCELKSTKYEVSLDELNLQGMYYVYVLAKGDGATYNDSENAASAHRGILTLNKTNLSIPSGSNYNSGAERAATVGGVDFGSKYTCAPSETIQGQKANMQIYNKTTLGKILSLAFTQTSSRTVTLYVHASTSAPTTGTTITGSTSGSTTTYNCSGSTYGFFNLCSPTGGAIQISSIVIVYE